MSEEKKNPPRAQIFRYFRIESRNNENLKSIHSSNREKLKIRTLFLEKEIRTLFLEKQTELHDPTE